MNQQWRLARTPVEGWPTNGDFEWVESDMPDPGSGQVLTLTLFVSMDPYQWSRRRSGTEQPGDVCHGRSVSRVIAGKTERFTEGDIIFNTNGWQAYGLTGEGITTHGYMFPRKLDPGVAPVSTALGVLGMLGLTAYSGLIVQCEPRAGETVVVSAASGGVGQVAVQLARTRGARVVGVAGSEEKCRFVVEELGAAACVSHRDPEYAGVLAAACPDGIDVYFENVGGAVYEGVLALLNRNARITVCGYISQYGNEDGRNPREVWDAMGAATFERQNVAVHDLFVGNFVEAHQERFVEEMGARFQAGEIVYREHVYDGLESAPRAFGDMLAGRNFGKTLVRCSDEARE
ncbi:MAG: NADP-dependent oxidoreductase [Pseudomonadales bacterium]|nr:NADP-dependent oxidoreductase [Pseudomonadales bacterium]MDP6470418.1 NADP-dependent oxidoreductase [Pseudomonadales bacterium]MDP6827718.1 NADP-dependent oxidoreductase [Pseudomonadales bacterium]MDP6973363.1 NADP-dependent oxidoreductase [Pseudomonadales bacterium]